MTNEEELKKTLTDLGTAFEAFKTEMKTASKDPLFEQKLAGIQQKLDDLTGKRDDLEKRIKLEADHREELERKVNQLRFEGNKGSDEIEQKAIADWNVQIKAIARTRQEAEPADQTLEEFRAYKAAATKYFRKGADALSSEERKAMSVGSDVDGGFFVTPDVSGTITKKVYEISQIRQIASVQAISSDALEGIQDLDTATAGWVGETQSRPATATPQVGKYRIEANEMYSQPSATQKLLDDSAVDVEAWLSGKVSNVFARTEGIGFISGTGAAQPRGFTTYPTVATGDATRAWDS